MKYALVHDWLVNYGGSERVLERLIELLPDADVFTIVDSLKPDEREFLHGRPVQASFIQKLPFAFTKYRHFFPLMPLAIEQVDVTDYDVVISSSHAFAKGVITRGDQLHISYVHTPVRYAWELQHEYLRQAGLDRGLKSAIVRMLLHYVRQWDHGTADRVDVFVCNSRYVARRVWRVYRRRAQIVYPPVDIDKFTLQTDKDDFYLAASRFVPYKRMKTIVEAFAQLPNRRLVVIGDGPEFQNVKAIATPNVELLGFQEFDKLRETMQHARAFIFAADEDFGIMPVEAQACGTPVIAFRRGGVTESVVEGRTGLFFDEQTADAIADAVRRFERRETMFEPGVIREHATKFRPEVFMERMEGIISAAEFARDRLEGGHDGDHELDALESVTDQELAAASR
jgi:glycosyltransferase involved in cell wall biosynthesis